MKKIFSLISLISCILIVGCGPTKHQVRQEPHQGGQSIAYQPKEIKARLAIIIDDAGHNLRALEPLLALPVKIDVAILPHLRYSSHIAEVLHENGFELVLHQPMEPINEALNPGPGVILTSMTEDEIVNLFQENIESIPHLSGVNNHMGSKVTSDQRLMEVVLQVTSQNELFFIDSLTYPSRVKEAAKIVGVSIGERDVFLDNDKELEAIKTQVRKLKKIALKKGKAIGIGHFFPVTIQAISEILPEMEQEGIAIVPVSQLIE